jgi:hypothetical protein
VVEVADAMIKALMHMIKKRQLVVEVGAEGRTAAEQFYALAA